MKVTKAVIPAAGLGTRLLPATKAVPKNLLPIVDRPIIQYAVEELVRAGVEEVWIVISKGQEPVVDHFRPSQELESALAARGKSELLEEMHRIQQLAAVDFIYQEEPLGLGHAVGCAAEKIGKESFAALLPDELFDPGENFLKELIKVHIDTGDSTVAVHEVPGEDIRLYGAIDPADETSSIMEVKGVVEKPDPTTTPSHLSLSGRYVLSSEIFEVLDDLPPGAGNEIQLADGLDVLARRGKVKALLYEGRRWDVGKVEGLLQANVSLAIERTDVGPQFVEFLDRRKR